MKKLYSLLISIIIACTNLNAQTWSPVGSGTNGLVQALGVYNGELYAGGFFSSAGGVAANRIAKWNGTEWSPVSLGMDSTVTSFGVYNGELYTGGFFNTAGGNSAQFLAKWNGTNWSAVGDFGGVYDGDVGALVVYNGELYAGGWAMSAGSVGISSIMKWNGMSWSALGSGIDDGVFSFAVYNGELYIGGNFTIAGGIPANYIAKWNGTSWSALGSGMNERVFALAVYNGELYAGGYFTTAGGMPVNKIAKWNGSSWTPVSSGITGGLYNVGLFALHAYNGELYAGGNFTTAGNSLANSIAKWNGSSWSGIGTGVNSSTSISGQVYALSEYNGELYAGGYFTTTGGISANHVTKLCSPPTQPAAITGNTTATVGQNFNYSIGAGSNGIEYNWSLSGGGNIISGQNTTTISVNWFTTGNHTLSVNATNGCGASANQTLDISVSIAQTTFQKIYGDSLQDEYGGSVQQTSEGGYVIAGSSNGDIYLIKTDSNGKMLWNKTFGGPNLEGTLFVRQTSDLGYILSGAGEPNYNLIIIRVDSSGNLLWLKEFSTGGNVWGFSCLQATDGGFVFSGDSEEDVLLFKLNANGDLLWSHRFDAGGFEEGLGMHQTSDGGFCIAGLTHNGPPGYTSRSAYLIKTDASGNLLWSRSYDLGLWDNAFSVQQCSDGGFILAGSTGDLDIQSFDIYLLKTDSAGNVLWSKLFDAPGWNFAQTVLQTKDQGFLVIGNNNFATSNSDIWLIKTNADGNIMWSKTYGGSGEELAWRSAAGEQTADGGYIIGGKTSSFSTSIDLYIIKTDADGNSGCNEKVLMPTVSSPVIHTIIPSTTVTNSNGILSNLTLNIASSGKESTICPPCTIMPLRPDTILGNTLSCAGSSQIFSVSPSNGATTYTWALPSGWTGGSTTNSISTIVGNNSGNISVTANNSCGNSLTQSLFVTVTSPLSQPDTIQGPVFPCAGSSQVYFVAAVSGATNYTWALPSGWTGNSTTNSITAIVGNDSGHISMIAGNSCDNSVTKALHVTITHTPSSPGTITGDSLVSVGQTINYSIGPVSGATEYNWSLTGGGIFISGQKTTSVFINWLSPGNYTLSVNAANNCGSSSHQILNITVSSVPYIPFEIRIMPNPFAGVIYLNAKGAINKLMKIEIFNMAGQLVYRGQKRVENNDFLLPINLSKVAAGVYRLMIIMDDRLYGETIVKLN